MILSQRLLQDGRPAVPDRAAVRGGRGGPRRHDLQRQRLHACGVRRHQHQLERRLRAADRPQPLRGKRNVAETFPPSSLEEPK